MELLNFLCDIPTVSVILVVVIPFLFYWYSKRNHDYWKKRGIPYVKPYPFIGSHPMLEKKGWTDGELDRYKKYGDIYGYFEGSKPKLTVGKPELLRDVLVKDFQRFSTRRAIYTGDPIVDKMLISLNGDDWKRIRTIVTPTFSTGKIKRMISIFQDCSKTLLQNFMMDSVKGKPSNAFRLYGTFTMDVIASSAFSTKLDSHNDPENEFVKSARRFFSQGWDLRAFLLIFIPDVLRKLVQKVFKFEGANFFKQVTKDIILERKRTGQTRNDFLQLLIDATTEIEKDEKSDETEGVVAKYGDESKNHPIFKNASTKRLSMDELVAQCVIFFLAGYHTTSITLSMTSYLLAMHEEVQEKLLKEITDVLMETKGELTYESVQKMKYLDNIVSEAIRIYPPAIKFERTADADYQLGDTNILVQKGVSVKIPVLALHRDPKYFPDPLKFNPNRFSFEGKEKVTPYSYLPFGAGPRNCIGMRFALLELKVCLIHVFSAFHVKKCSETEVPVEFNSKSAHLLSPTSITLKFIPRENCPVKS